MNIIFNNITAQRHGFTGMHTPSIALTLSSALHVGVALSLGFGSFSTTKTLHPEHEGLVTFEALTGGGAPNLGKGQEDGTDLPAARAARSASKPSAHQARSVEPPSPHETREPAAATDELDEPATPKPSHELAQGSSAGADVGVGTSIGTSIGKGVGAAFGTAHGTGVSSSGRGTGVGIGSDLAGLARGYLGQLESYLGRNHQYPLAARRARLQGVVEVEITIQPTGQITSVRVVRSSGHDILDEAAISRLRTLRTVPPPPPALHWKARTIKYPVVYRVG